MQTLFRADAGPTISVGECMVELGRGADGRFGLAYGGDTFNTAVYLARAGVPVAYATALGDDPYSEAILEIARREGVGTDPVIIVAGRTPGLYLIETNHEGERTFYYWRDHSPARDLFELDGGSGVADMLAKAGLIYVSGITLSLYTERGLSCLADALTRARKANATIVMDSNYRPRGWRDPSRAKDVMRRFWGLAHVGLPTFDDEAQLWGDGAARDTIARLRDLGVVEVAVKLGAKGALVGTSAGEVEVLVKERVKPVDTTGAGDSFNAAYMAARLGGRAPDAAADAGNRLAGIVVQHRGAIVPREATERVLSPARATRTPDARAR